MFITVPEKLYTKTIVSKGYGFNTPQDGSVCKIKVILDEANLLSGLDENQVKEIIVGDVDECIERIIEDCIRTMKENEECVIEFMHPEASTENIIQVEDSIDKKDVNNDTTTDCLENSKIDADSAGDPSPESQTPSDVEGTKEENNDESSDPPPEVPVSSTEENADTCDKTPSTNLVQIQFQLLTYTTEPEIWEMSVTEKWRRASYHKERGLELYARGMYQYAFRRFGLTLKYLISLEHDVPSGEEGMDIKGLKLSCYLNLAACQMRHHNFESVVKNSSKALNLQPNNAKALYRRGAAYLELQEYEKAKEDLLAAQQLEPKNQAIAKQLQILKCRVQKLNQYYASAMKKMFS